MKLIQQVKMVLGQNPTGQPPPGQNPPGQNPGENSLFIFTVCVRSVPLYDFKLAYGVLHMAVKEFFESHFLKWRNRPF